VTVAPAHSEPKLPPAAQAAGYTLLAFQEEFSSDAGIEKTGACKDGYSFYTHRPFGWPPSPANTIDVRDGVLTVTGDGHAVMTIVSACKLSTGKWLGFAASEGAYFEAAISFDPDGRIKNPDTDGYPGFWSMAMEHLSYNSYYPKFIEVDFLEYNYPKWHGKHQYMHAIHKWVGKKRITPNLGEMKMTVPEGTDFNNFNRFGTLWKPGETIDTYFNDKLLRSFPFADFPEYSVGDDQHLPVILGAGNKWPMKVDWVRVWVKDDDSGEGRD
jgi:hypothetical protein